MFVNHRFSSISDNIKMVTGLAVFPPCLMSVFSVGKDSYMWVSIYLSSILYKNMCPSVNGIAGTITLYSLY